LGNEFIFSDAAQLKRDPLGARTRSTVTILRSMPLGAAILLPLAATLAACTDNQCKGMGFERFRSTDSVIVADNYNKPLRTITDTQTLLALSSFAINHKSGWGAPWYGTPVALLQVQFYGGSKFLGDLDVGSDFLVAQGCGDFLARSVSARDRYEVMKLLSVPDPYESIAR
jgi:hypothetical protein